MSSKNQQFCAHLLHNEETSGARQDVRALFQPEYVRRSLCPLFWVFSFAFSFFIRYHSNVKER